LRSARAVAHAAPGVRIGASEITVTDPSGRIATGRLVVSVRVSD